MPEQALQRRPAEEVGVHDLVAVATQDELAGVFEQREHQRQLYRRQVLHFVDDDAVVDGRSYRGDFAAPGVGDEVAVVEARFGQPRTVALEQAMRQLALLGVQQALPMALAPGRERRQRHLAARRHAQRLEQLAIAEELDLLLRVLEAMRGVQRAGALREIRREGDVQHPALGLAQPRQGDRRLARACRDDHHQRRRAGSASARRLGSRSPPAPGTRSRCRHRRRRCQGGRRALPTPGIGIKPECVPQDPQA
jgi:hypothetical protein